MTMHPRRILPALAALATVFVLAGCGGGGNASIGGTVSGLNAAVSLVLEDNNTDSLTVSANGSFTFGARLDPGSTYSVTILTQPPGEVCEVANGTGQLATDAIAVNDIAIACITTASIGGTVSGLPAGTAVTLTDGTVLLPVAADGPFYFPGVLTAGTDYQVTVATQPVGATCTVSNGSGTINAGSQAAVTVSCS